MKSVKHNFKSLYKPGQQVLLKNGFIGTITMAYFGDDGQTEYELESYDLDKKILNDSTDDSFETEWIAYAKDADVLIILLSNKAREMVT